jgi:hypothetical protein
MAEGGDLRGFDALGKLGAKLGGLCLGVDGGVAGDGVDGCFGGVGAAAEETGEKASQAQGSYFKKVAFGA